MFYSYTPKGTCSHQIEFEIDNGILKNVSFAGGCNGNLKALSILVEGMPCSEVIDKLSGIRCGFRPTSCSDQLTKAVSEAMENEK
ncbi:MAG: TIGR03905 family TSCPD domain-containing protein [Anaerovoracaceae bacterium]|nr:TIGR03905 family TSCPD domain-containing protein [Anaerovoracaceae bacterium]